MQRASAISASIGQTVAPLSDFRMGTKRHFSRIPPYPAVVVPPGELHTAPMGMKLGSYPGLGTDGLWCKGLALSPRQSARRSPHFQIFGWGQRDTFHEFSPESWNFYETLGMWWGYGPPNRGDQWWGRMRGQNR